MTEKRKTIINKIIYAICGLLLMVIDWTRGSQVGTTWAWTVNMMGVVIGVILITADGWNHYIRKKYAIYSTAMMVAFPLAYEFWENHQTLIYRDKLLSAVANVWVLGICIIRLSEFYRFHKPKFKDIFDIHEVLVLLLFGWMFFSVNEDVWPVWFLILFCICATWPLTNLEQYSIMNGMASGIIASFFILQGLAFVFRPFDTDYHRYCGIYSNPNINALFYSVVLIAFLFKLYQLRQNNGKLWLRVLAYLFSVAMVAFIVLTVSKTAWVSVFICLSVYVIFGLLKKHNSHKAILVRIGVSLLLLTICVPIVYLPVRYIPPLFHHPIWYEGEYAEWRVHSWDPWNSPKYVSFQEVTGAVSERLLPVVEKFLPADIVKLQHVYAEEKSPDGIYIGDKFYPYTDENTLRYSSYLGRMATWYYYFTNGKIAGHSNTEGHYVGIGYTYNWHAQNAFLQIWYYYGVPAGILFLIVIIWALVRSIKRVLKTEARQSEMACFVMMYLTLFITYGLFEAVWYPGQMIMTLAFFSPLLMKQSLLEDDTDEEVSNPSL